MAEKIEKSVSAIERASSKLVKESKLRYDGPEKGNIGRCLRVAMSKNTDTEMERQEIGLSPSAVSVNRQGTYAIVATWAKV